MSLIRKGDTQSFAYTGQVQTLTIQRTGIYKFEVWGGQGTNCEKGYAGSGTGGCGGHCVGYKMLRGGKTLTIGIGGGGKRNSGFNGGGTVTGSLGWGQGAGGGATHFAVGDVSRGQLKEYINNQEEVIIVAGGGGGACNSDTIGGGYTMAGGPSGTGGYQFGQGQNNTGNERGAGGGGWSGGTGNSGGHTGKGGTSYIGNCPVISYRGKTYAPSLEEGVWGTSFYSGKNSDYDGKATITLVELLNFRKISGHWQSGELRRKIGGHWYSGYLKRKIGGHWV